MTQPYQVATLPDQDLVWSCFIPYWSSFCSPLHVRSQLFKNLEAYWDKLFKQVKDEKGTCEVCHNE